MIPGCGQQIPNVENQIHKNTKINVSFDIKPELVEGKLFIKGNTNLPDKMELIIILFRGESYSAQHKVKIKDGKLISEGFSHKGEPLRNGQYEIKISSPATRFQDKSVQNIIGNKGENLTGNLVRKNSEKFQEDNFIEYTTNYVVGNSVEVKSDLSDLSKDLNVILSHYRKLIDANKNNKVNGTWSANWNRRLSKLRSDFDDRYGSNINEYKGECPQAFFNISVASGYMYNVWSEYFSVISGRGSKKVFNDMKVFVKEHVNEAQNALNKCKKSAK